MDPREIDRHAAGWLAPTDQPKQAGLDGGVAQFARLCPREPDLFCPTEVVAHCTLGDPGRCRNLPLRELTLVTETKNFSNFAHRVAVHFARRCPTALIAYRPDPTSSFANPASPTRCPGRRECAPALRRNRRPDAAGMCARVIPESVPKCRRNGRPSAAGIRNMYTGYNVVTGTGKRDRAGCLAHVRRRFFDALPYAPEGRVALELIRDVYVVERDAIGAGVAGTEEHRRMRQTRTGPIMARFMT